MPLSGKKRRWSGRTGSRKGRGGAQAQTRTAQVLQYRWPAQRSRLLEQTVLTRTEGVLRSKRSGSTSYTVKYLRGHDGYNCVGAGATFSGGGGYPPLLDIMKTAPFKTRTCPTPYCKTAPSRKSYETMHDLWQKLASARSINPKNSLCMPPKLAVELSPSTNRHAYGTTTTTHIICMG
jgi:hypothetical protein